VPLSSKVEDTHERYATVGSSSLSLCHRRSVLCGSAMKGKRSAAIHASAPVGPTLQEDGLLRKRVPIVDTTQKKSSVGTALRLRSAN
jgi:hypothetical protein